MKNQLEIGGKAVEQAARATKSVLVVQIFLVCTVLAIFSMLVKREGQLHDAIREDAIWAVYQLDRETRAVYELVQHVKYRIGEAGVEAAQEAVAPRELVTRYDILYSRLSVLANSKYNVFFEQSPNFRSRITTIQTKILAIEPVFNEIAAKKNYTDIDFAPVEETLEKIRSATNEFLVRTNATISEARAEARNDVFHVQMLAFLFMFAIVVAALFLALHMLLQVRIVKQTREGMNKAAAEFEKAYEAAEAGNKAKSEFLATIGHEIRTPLNGILGMAELLAQKQLPEEETGYVRTITSSGNTLLEMINEILDFAKIEYGSLETEQIVFRLDELVQEAAAVVEGKALEQNDELKLNIDPTLEKAFIKSDPTRLKRVLLNLLSNAVKFTENGSIHVDVVAGKVVAETLELKISVKDSGIGIAEEAQKQLFTAFHQVDSSISRRFGGTGLGLAICKQIVEAMGGSIGVFSIPGEGATFSFTLPVQLAHAPAANLTGLDSGSTPTALIPRLRILLVEDNVINQRVATKLLERLGQEVIVASDGREAIKHVQDATFDLVLMDVQMPDLDGIAATRLIRNIGAPFDKLPIVAMTANASDRHRQDCLDAGMNAFESKPVTFQRLATILREYGPSDTSAEGITDLPTSPGSPEPTEQKHAAQSDAATPNANVVRLAGEEKGDARRAELREELGEEVFHSLVNAFFENADTLVVQVTEAASSGDGESYDRLLHTLKGAADNLGFTTLSKTADALRTSIETSNQVTLLTVELEKAKNRYRKIAI
ncbi:Autoinducer 2 sensor kinase/phosphatase LuxQ [Labrenzia sp. THAF35]|uniref:ATP-binding protein n=1 Tax=Labrenzia sp. THAF35 TaxID=2587854 RepID=UPI0012692896|nr:ATP-binding protein [Labrenzia sp. THAF35]QFT68110.1 Autoinducer 2 sensor kinase/phosphatase LuxQ [Labrenzia sp. THAF35]